MRSLMTEENKIPQGRDELFAELMQVLQMLRSSRELSPIASARGAVTNARGDHVTCSKCDRH